MNIKENQKYQATHQAIMSALIELLEEKNIKQVTVASVCRAVHINRSTFYEHFLDVYDVLDQIADNIRKDVEKNVPQEPPTKEDFIYLLRHIQANKKFYLLFFHQNLPLNIYEKFFLSKQPPLPPRAVLEALGIQNDIQLEYRRAFFRAGQNAMLKKWLERDCAESPEEIIEMMHMQYSGK